MASQPHPSREGSGGPHDHDGQPTNSSDFPFIRNSKTFIPPPPTTVEQPQLQPPTVDDLLPDPIADQPILDTLLNKEHQLCFVEMESLRDAIEPHGLTPEKLVAFLRIVWHLIVLFLSCGMIRLWIVLLFAIYLVSLKWCFAMGLFFVAFRHCLLANHRKNLRATDSWPSLDQEKAPHYLLIVCGSGGHTGEMIRMIENSIRPEGLSHRRWALAYHDHLSYDKVMNFEHKLVRRFDQQQASAGTFDIELFHRPRAVHQSWFTTPFTSFACLIEIFGILTTAPGRHTATQYQFPGVIVTDGPGCGFLFLLAAHWLKMCFIVSEEYMRTIFVESWARVTSLSLSGSLIDYLILADVFIVQYRKLTGNRAAYTGNFVAMPSHGRRPH
ncbi:glycosyltransferase family 1 protein [Jackrogersella minutella]|nr:glycosyltransferase family 1 protein [Jackrogersella minutella]